MPSDEQRDVRTTACSNCTKSHVPVCLCVFVACFRQCLDMKCSALVSPRPSQCVPMQSEVDVAMLGPTQPNRQSEVGVTKPPLCTLSLCRSRAKKQVCWQCLPSSLYPALILSRQSSKTSRTRYLLSTHSTTQALLSSSLSWWWWLSCQA